MGGESELSYAGRTHLAPTAESSSFKHTRRLTHTIYIYIYLYLYCNLHLNLHIYIYIYVRLVAFTPCGRVKG